MLARNSDFALLAAAAVASACLRMTISSKREELAFANSTVRSWTRTSNPCLARSSSVGSVFAVEMRRFRHIPVEIPPPWSESSCPGRQRGLSRRPRLPIQRRPRRDVLTWVRRSADPATQRSVFAVLLPVRRGTTRATPWSGAASGPCYL